MPPHIVDLNDYVVNEWSTTREGEERQAAEAALFYKTLFKHPLVEAVTWWSFSDGGWLNAPAGLMTADSRIKPAYDELYRLIKGEWWTPEARTVTDQDGWIEVSGFKGGYLASCGDVEFEFEIN